MHIFGGMVLKFKFVENSNETEVISVDVPFANVLEASSILLHVAVATMKMKTNYVIVRLL